jgi:flavodoxin
LIECLIGRKPLRVLVTYFSKTGNTKKIAEHIRAILKSKNYQVDMCSYDKINEMDLYRYYLYFIGSPCHSNDVVKPIKNVIDRLTLVKKANIFGFVTHSTETVGEYYQKWAYNCEKYYLKLSNSGNINLIGYYHCKAKPNFLIKLFIKKMVVTDTKAWEEYRKDIMDHPNQDDFRKLEATVEEALAKLQ